MFLEDSWILMLICFCLSAVEKDPDIVGTWDGGGGVKSHSDFKRYSVSMKQISQYCWNISGWGMSIGSGGVKSRSDFKRYSVSMKQISQYCWNISGCGMNIGGGGVKSRSGLAVRVNKQVHTLAEGWAQK